MAIHHEVLDAARRICVERGSWTFTPNEIVRALPHLAPNSIRTHVTSRCAVNAPAHHPHRWDYFRRLRHGVYEIRPKWRPAGTARGRARNGHETHAERPGRATRVGEARAVYGAAPARDTVHAFVGRWLTPQDPEHAAVLASPVRLVGEIARVWDELAPLWHASCANA